MLSAVIVHPTYRTVFPIMLEPILISDGMTKNDCEHNALKRLLINLRKAHPHLPIIMTLDGLYADGVIVQLLQHLDIRFIISAHEKDLSYLYEFYQIQEFACKHFQAALKKLGRSKYLWERMRSYFFLCLIDSWEHLYTAMSENLWLGLAI